MYGMDIIYKNKKFTSETKLDNFASKNVIIFDCTDNLKARKSIEDSVNLNRNLNSIIISCGNEDTFGQVIYSFKKANYYKSKEESLGKLFNILHKYKNPKNDPTVINKIDYSETLLEMFPDFKDTEKPSCTDIELQDDQSMPINSTVAQIAYNMFYEIISGKELNYNIVKCNINNIFTTNIISIDYLIRAFCKNIYGDYNETILESALEAHGIKVSWSETKGEYKVLSDYVVKFKKYAIPFLYYCVRIHYINYADLNKLIDLAGDKNANI